MNWLVRWKKNPRVTMFIGMSALAAGFSFLKFAPTSARFNVDVKDGVFGFLIGISMAMNLWTVKLKGRLGNRGGS